MWSVENSVADLLPQKAQLNPVAKQILLNEPIFTDEDNAMLCALPTEEEVKEILSSSKQHVAPCTDEIYRKTTNSFPADLPYGLWVKTEEINISKTKR